MCDGLSELALGSAATSAVAAGGAAAAAGTTGAVLAGTAATAGLIGTGGVVSSGLLTGLQIATAAAGLWQAHNVAQSQTISNNAQTTAALQARAENSNQVGLEEVQQHDLASQKINDNNTNAREASASYLAQGQVGGHSVDAYLGDIAGKSGRYDTSVTSNLGATNMALGNQMQNINTNADNVIAAEKTPALPDYLGTSLRIGGDYADYLRGPK